MLTKQEEREQAARILETETLAQGHYLSLVLQPHHIVAFNTAIAALRSQGWVRTSERAPTLEDADNEEEIYYAADIGMNNKITISDYTAHYGSVADDPEYYVFWHRKEKLPPLPEIK